MSEVSVARVHDLGMITLRGDLSDPAFGNALSVPIPEPRRINEGEVRLAWMSPDELLAICPRGQVAGYIEALKPALSGQHHLVADVSDARAAFRLTGADAALRETLAKLTPADMRPASLPRGEIRRTRLAQVAGAFWIDEGQATVICFRSVATYMEDILRVSAKVPVGHF